MSKPVRPTLNDVAAKAGVGVATVDRVINRRAPVRAETAQRVLEAAQSLGFHGTPLLRKRVQDQAQDRQFGFLLQKSSQSFYQALARELIAATKESSRVHGKAHVLHLDDLAPSAVAARIRELSRRVDALAVVAADHPRVNEAIEEATERGVPVFTLLSDLSTPRRAGFIGLDHRRAGRTAGWCVARLAKRPGTVAIFVGSHRYLGHDLCEISFRSYLREHAAAYPVLEPRASFEEVQHAHDEMRDLLKREPNLAGVYVAGAGVEGIIEALRTDPRARDVVLVCNELTPETREALVDGIVDVVIGTPLPRLAACTVEAMRTALNAPAPASSEFPFLPFDLFVSENV